MIVNYAIANQHDFSQGQYKKMECMIACGKVQHCCKKIFRQTRPTCH